MTTNVSQIVPMDGSTIRQRIGATSVSTIARHASSLIPLAPHASQTRLSRSFTKPIAIRLARQISVFHFQTSNAQTVTPAAKLAKSSQISA